MGLVIIGALMLYLLVAIAAVIGTVKFAKKNGKSAKRWGWSVALVMYLIPFWDWMPTVAMHRYYCSKEAGFWVYKTVDQWEKENPGVIETLVPKPIANVRIQSERIDENNWKSSHELNDRFEYSYEHRGPLPIYRWETEVTLKDGKTNEVLVRSIDFYTAQTRAGGGWSGWKFWLSVDHCSTHRDNSQSFLEYLTKIKGSLR